MIKDKEIIEGVREDIVNIFGRVYYEKYGKEMVHTEEDYKVADAVLSHPNIAIIDPDAELPKPPREVGSVAHQKGFYQGYWECQQDVKQAGWGKVVYYSTPG